MAIPTEGQIGFLDSPMNAHVVHLTSAHDIGDARIFLKECRSLVAAGYRVTLVATGVVPERCIREGVSVIAVRKYQGRLARMTLGAFRVLLRGLIEGGRVFHIHDPELMPWALGLRLLGRIVIFDAHEDLPKQIMSKHYIHQRLRFIFSKLATLLELLVGRIAHRVVAATPSIARNFPQNRVTLIQNFPMEGELSCGVRNGAVDPYFAYVGGISRIRGMREMVSALGLLDQDARLWLAGPFETVVAQNELSEVAGWNRVSYLGSVTRTRVGEILASAKAGLVLFLPVPNHIESQPNKLFEYMSAGIPVIASNFPRWVEIVDGNMCGLVVDPQDHHAIAMAMNWILGHPEEAQAMGARGQLAVRERYNWTNESVKLVELYHQLIGKGDLVVKKI